MPTLLHILTRPADPLVEGILASQKAQPDNRVLVVDLTAPEPDYAALVERVFEADSIASW